ncbi:MAG: acyl-CoA thioesterase [Micrococcales bacterium]|nr:acyl-CoA thioesterase [Micrococcales bacterium]
MTRMHVPVPLRWNDLDAYGHVNNAAMFVLLEEARIHAFWSTDEALAQSTMREGSGTLSLVARQEIEYVAPIPYLRDPLDVQMWIGHLGGASFSACYEVHSPASAPDDVLYARAQTTMVLVDVSTQRPRRLTDAERTAWEPYLEEPVAFTRR